MDTIAESIVRKSIKEELKGYKTNLLYEVYIVWKCKTLQNWKYLIGTTLPDNKYYELTYNGDKREWYLDTYVKVKNEVVTQE